MHSHTGSLPGNVENLATSKVGPKRVISASVDNAAINAGVHNIIFELMQKELASTHLVMVGYVCYPLQLAYFKLTSSPKSVRCTTDIVAQMNSRRCTDT